LTFDSYPIELTEFEYDVLKNNHLISTVCARQLNSPSKVENGVALSLTLPELTDLIGYLAAEANHARKKREREDLNTICDYLESLEFDIKWHPK
jgi:hypothetical protein